MLHVETGNFIEDTLSIVIEHEESGRKKIVAVGKEAERSEALKKNNCSLLNAFEHPRCCVRDFDLASGSLRYYIFKILNRKIFVRPIVVIHPLEKTEGGLTDLEKRGLIELAEDIGGRKNIVWIGRMLTNHELIKLSFVET